MILQALLLLLALAALPPLAASLYFRTPPGGAA